jgi:benzil reductase ((S)-benzoin forming)
MAVARSLIINMQAPLVSRRVVPVATRTRNFALQIINVRSVAANRPIPGWSAYCVGQSAANISFSCIAADKPWIRTFGINRWVLGTDMQAEIRTASVEETSSRDDSMGFRDRGRLRDALAVARKS